MRVLLILIAMLLGHCSIKSKKAPEPVNVPTLGEVRALYQDLIVLVQDEAGFIETEKCDSLLLTALARVGGATANLEAAYANDQWYRTPHHNCYSEGRSRSECSRDMILGLIFVWWWERDLARLEELWSWLQDNDWRTGDGEPGGTYFNPNFQAVLAKVIYALGGRRHNQGRIPDIPNWGRDYTDYEAHLQLLMIYLVGEAEGKIPQAAYNRIKTHYERNPENALYAFMYHKYEDGDFQKVVNILMSPQWYPHDRLPTEADRCHEWLVLPEHTAKNINPCKDKRDPRHSGGDLLFIAALLDREREREK